MCTGVRKPVHRGKFLARRWSSAGVLCTALAMIAIATPVAAQKPRSSERETARVLAARLSGSNQALTPGDPKARGVALIRIYYTARRLCWRITVRDLAGATAAHLHKGEVGQAGPPMLTLSVPENGEPAQGCIAVERAILRDMLLNPGSYHVNVHSSRYPTGAVRGQLFSP